MKLPRNCLSESRCSYDHAYDHDTIYTIRNARIGRPDGCVLRSTAHTHRARALPPARGPLAGTCRSARCSQCSLRLSGPGKGAGALRMIKVGLRWKAHHGAGLALRSRSAGARVRSTGDRARNLGARYLGRRVGFLAFVAAALLFALARAHRADGTLGRGLARRQDGA